MSEKWNPRLVPVGYIIRPVDPHGRILPGFWKCTESSEWGVWEWHGKPQTTDPETARQIDAIPERVLSRLQQQTQTGEYRI